MEIHIKLAGTELGPYSGRQVQDYLLEGLLSAHDLARMEGSETWEPVSELLARQPPIPLAPLPEPTLAANPTPLPAPSLPSAPEAVSLPPPAFSTSPAPLFEPPRQALPIRVKTPGKKIPSHPMPGENSPEVSGKIAPRAIRVIPKIKSPEAVPIQAGAGVAKATPQAQPFSSEVPTILPVRALHKKTSSEARVGSLAPSASPSLSSTVRALVKTVDPGANATPSSAAPLGPTANSQASSLPALEKNPTFAPPAIKVLSKKNLTKPLPSVGIQLAPLNVPDVVPAAPPPITPAPILPDPATPISPPKERLIVPPRRIPFRVYSIAGLLVVLGIFYLTLPYSCADALWRALNNAQESQLEGVIDFPALRQSLKNQMEGQLTKLSPLNSPGQSSSIPNSDALAMIERSIDLYVTPQGIAKLARKSTDFSRSDQTPTISPDVAANLFLGLDNQTVKSRQLVSFDDFVIELETARLHLQFYGLSWKLNRIELKTLPTLSSLPTAPTTSISPGSILTTPVVETYLDQGKSAYQKNDWDTAIADFNQVLAINPKMTAAYNNRAFARQAKGDIDGAIADFNQALAIDPRLAEVYLARGNAKETKGDIAAALADFTQAIDIDSKMEGAYYSRGNARAASADFDGAIADYTVVISLDPNQANAFSNRGFARRAKNDFDGALADYTQALAIDPKLAEAYYNRGLVRQAQANADGAILDFNQALDLDPKMVGAYFNRGNAKNTLHDFDGAIADYNQALTLNPKLPLAWCNRGLAKQGRDDLDGAIADYSQALLLDPKIAIAWYNRGLIKEQTNDLDGAIADSTHAIDLDAGQAQAYYNRGFAKLTKGDLVGSAADLRKFCELAPRDHYSDHARLYLWMIVTAQGGKSDADQALCDSLLSDWNSTSDDLVSKIADFLLDRKSEAELIADAVSSDAKKDQGQHCEVWYFAGMKRLLTGDKPTATDYFHRCVATEKKDYCEYILAKTELQSLVVSTYPPKP